jgi:exonuclease V
MQLMLYRYLSNLATNKVDADVLFNRYELNSSATFTDGFIAQVGSLNEVFYDAPAEPNPSQDLNSSQDSMQVLLDNNSLKQLWALMIQEFQRTMPPGSREHR